MFKSLLRRTFPPQPCLRCLLNPHAPSNGDKCRGAISWDGKLLRYHVAATRGPTSQTCRQNTPKTWVSQRSLRQPHTIYFLRHTHRCCVSRSAVPAATLPVTQVSIYTACSASSERRSPDSVLPGNSYHVTPILLQPTSGHARRSFHMRIGLLTWAYYHPRLYLSIEDYNRHRPGYGS